MQFSIFILTVSSFFFTLPSTHYVTTSQLFSQDDTSPPQIELSQREFYNFNHFNVNSILTTVIDDSPYSISYHHDALHVGKNTICVQAKDIYHNQTTKCNDYQLLSINNQNLATYLDSSLLKTIQSYLTKNNISNEQIGLGVYDLTAKETVWINQNQPFVAASSIKFPIGVVLYDKIAKGELSKEKKLIYAAKHNEGGTTLIPRYYVYGDRIPITTLLRYMLVYSDNNATQILLDELRGFGELQTQLLSFFPFDSSQIEIYKNTVTPTYFMSALHYVLAHESVYQELKDYLITAYPSRYLKKYVNEIPILHKCGFYQGNINDVGIVYGNSPYAIVIMTKQLPQAEEHIGRINELVYHYKNSIVSSSDQQRSSQVKRIFYVDTVDFLLESIH